MKYWQKVRIKEWFYEWIEWTVIRYMTYAKPDYKNDILKLVTNYWIRIDDWLDNNLIEYFPEENLILIESNDD